MMLDLLTQILKQLEQGSTPAPDPLVIATYCLVAATLAVALVSVLLGRQSANAQKELIQEQKNTSEIQKLAAQAMSRSAELEQKSLIMNAMFKINEMLNNETSRNQRHIILDYAAGTDNGAYEKVAEKVSGEFDQIGAMIQVSQELHDTYMSMHVRKTAKSWHALEKWVINERPIRHDDRFREHFELIGKDAVNRWKKDYPAEPLQIYKLDRKV